MSVLPFRRHVSPDAVYDPAKYPNPMLEGQSLCLACGDTRNAIAPIGTFWLHCPKCKTNRAVFRDPVVDFEVHDACTDAPPKQKVTCACGSEFFTVSNFGIHCISCGLFLPHDELPR